MKIKSALFLAGLTFACLNLSSCALMRYMCNKEYAAKKGMQDAEAGLTSMPGRLEGGKCDGGGDYAASDFSKDYNYGFLKKKEEVCQLSTAAAWGRADGEAGDGNRPNKTKLRLCEDMNFARLNGVYDKEFQKSFCAPARAEKLGKARAESWKPQDFETAFAECKGGNSKTLKAAYNRAYQDTMAIACTVDQAKKSGESEAAAKHNIDAVRDRLKNCSVNTKQKEALIAAFEASFKETTAKMDRETARAAAEAAAAQRKQEVENFLANTATSAFTFRNRAHTARCSVANDRSYVSVEVENPYAEQLLIRGQWHVVYYSYKFEKITEDQTQDAVLVEGNSRKAFQKMTLPRNAAYCRAEFVGVTAAPRPY